MIPIVCGVVLAAAYLLEGGSGFAWVVLFVVLGVLFGKGLELWARS